jgi:hypothetical protein
MMGQSFLPQVFRLTQVLPRFGQRPTYERSLEGDDWLRIDASAISVGHGGKVHALPSGAKLTMVQKIEARLTRWRARQVT